MAGARGVKERPRDVHNHFAAPLHDEAAGACNVGDFDGAQVLRVRGGDKAGGVPRAHHDGHALLRFGDGKLRSVQSLVFFGNGVKVNLKTRRKLSYGDRDTARAEVIAAADHQAYVPVAEQALDFALLHGVPFLNFSGRSSDGFFGVHFGRSGRAADSVPARAAAQQNDDIARLRRFPHDGRGGRGRNHGAALHALGRIAGMIQLRDLPRGKPDLIAVGAESLRRLAHQLELRKLSPARLGKRHSGIGRAGHAHGLVHPRAAGKRVADRAADAGRRAAERLYLRGVIVRLVLEHQQIALRGILRARLYGAAFFVARIVNVHIDRTGVVLLGHLHVGKQTALFQIFHADHGHIHERDGLIVPARVQLGAHSLIV